MQMVLRLSTTGSSLRSEAIGWDNVQDPRLVVPNKTIGLTPSSEEFYAYDCPLRAMAAGWHLLSPPKLLREESYFPGDEIQGLAEERSPAEWEWWFVKEV